MKIRSNRAHGFSFMSRNNVTTFDLEQQNTGFLPEQHSSASMIAMPQPIDPLVSSHAPTMPCNPSTASNNSSISSSVTRMKQQFQEVRTDVVLI